MYFKNFSNSLVIKAVHVEQPTAQHWRGPDRALMGTARQATRLLREQGLPLFWQGNSLWKIFSSKVSFN